MKRLENRMPAQAGIPCNWPTLITCVLAGSPHKSYWILQIHYKYLHIR